MSAPLILNAIQNVIGRRRQQQSRESQQDHSAQMQQRQIAASQRAQGMGMAENAVQAMEARDLLKQQMAAQAERDAQNRKHEMERQMEEARVRMNEQLAQRDFMGAQNEAERGLKREMDESEASRAFQQRRSAENMQSRNLWNQRKMQELNHAQQAIITDANNNTRSEIALNRDATNYDRDAAKAEYKRQLLGITGGRRTSRADLYRVMNNAGKLMQYGASPAEKRMGQEVYDLAKADLESAGAGASGDFGDKKEVVEIIEAPGGQRARKYPDGRIEPIN